MMKSKIGYSEISRAKVTESRNIVISNCSKGGFTIAQQLSAIENGKVTNVFMKGAFRIDDVHGLYNLRDAVNLAIKQSESGNVMGAEEDDCLEWDK